MDHSGPAGHPDGARRRRGSGPPLVRAVLRAGALTNEATLSSEDEDLEYSGDAVDAAMAKTAVARAAISEQDRTAEPWPTSPMNPT